MTITEFIETKPEIASIIRTDYIPFETKVAFANKCIRNNLTDKQMISMNTPLNYLTFVMSLLEMYTTLEVDPTKPLTTYNELQANGGLINSIVEELQNYHPDYKEYKVVYEMVSSDFRDNHLSPRGFIQKQVQKIASYCDEQLKVLNEALKEINTDDLKSLIKSLR